MEQEPAVSVSRSYSFGTECATCGKGLHRARSIVQNDVEQRPMNLDAAVVFDEAEFAKAVHEEADARPGRSNHLCQSFPA